MRDFLLIIYANMSGFLSHVGRETGVCHSVFRVYFELLFFGGELLCRFGEAAMCFVLFLIQYFMARVRKCRFFTVKFF
jgi:hypothetical protein